MMPAPEHRPDALRAEQHDGDPPAVRPGARSAVPTPATAMPSDNADDAMGPGRSATLPTALTSFLDHVQAGRGFLPPADPLRHLPTPFAPWEEVAHDLPKLLATRRVRPAVERMPRLDPSSLQGAEWNRAMVLLSFLGHAYVWERWQVSPAERIPASLAVPWHTIAQHLGRPPILSYASYALDNWRRIDPAEDIALENVALLQNFLGGLDEEWFVAVHVAIEAAAGPAIAALLPAQRAVADDDADALERHLTTTATAIEAMYAILCRMPEGCDPAIYFLRVRPYINGFSRHPVVYEGVAAYGGVPQRFFGETGAQSTIVPAIDAALDVAHAEDELRTYLVQMRNYMPPEHRAFLERVEQGPAIRPYVARHGASRLREAYNDCVRGIERFRAKHLEYAATYIQKQAQRGAHNSTLYGTGGTPFMQYLKKHRDETAIHVVEGD